MKKEVLKGMSIPITTDIKIEIPKYTTMKVVPWDKKGMFYLPKSKEEYDYIGILTVKLVNKKVYILIPLSSEEVALEILTQR